MQIVVGTHVEFVADALNQILGNEVALRAQSSSSESTATSSAPLSKPSSHAEVAAAILPLLGGKNNIVEVDNCITRLRLTVKDSSIVDQKAIKKITAGIIVPSKTAVQVIIGTEVEFVTEEFNKLV